MVALKKILMENEKEGVSIYTDITLVKVRYKKIIPSVIITYFK